MATGTIGMGSLLPNTWVGVTMDETNIVNINLCNTGVTTAKIDLYIGGGSGTPSGGVYIENQTDLKAYFPLERTGFAVTTGNKIWLRSNIGAVDYYIGGIAAL